MVDTFGDGLMAPAKRIIPWLDVDGAVVKGVNFVGIRDAGIPEMRRYNEEAPTKSPSLILRRRQKSAI